jgi:6-pyruvoyltetrahydropterin/6-carboxytetrahydropterin synthase|tara:strand:+ start:66 stop:431 length:366 start_codon:yes stop_codon:yes gene_type:complete
MFELTRKYEFHAARKLTGIELEHPCAQLHGHTFSVVIAVNGKIDDAKGWVIDFFDIDKIFKEEIYQSLDHKYLNDISGLENPTTELIAIWIWNKLKPHFNGLTKVKVSEGDSYGCTYLGGE